MKLIRFGEIGHEKPGIIDDSGNFRDVSTFIEDYNESFFENEGMDKLSILINNQLSELPILDKKVRLGAPVSRPSKLVCVGLNYAKHAAESGMAKPDQPVLFFKATSAICGPNDDLMLPKNSIKTDWEVELAIVIGKKASYVSVLEAMDCIAGYVLHNDYSERAFQLEQGGQWVKGKSADTFAPLGPFIATRDEIRDVHNLQLWLEVNGERLQDSNTSDMIFDVPYLVSYISQFMTLLPGDIISTGTPSGVGLGFKPPRYLKPGDKVSLGITGLGSSTQNVVSYQKR